MMVRMSIEIEAKIKVDRLDEFPARLEKLAAAFLSQTRQLDTLFDRDDLSLKNAGCSLRLRQEQAPAQTKTILCFKGPRQPGQFKNREEIELDVSSPDQAQALLARLGYRPRRQVEKLRQTWRLENCLICLDQVAGLGCFIEVEGPDEPTVARITASLGLDPADHLPLSYAALLAQKNKI